MFIVTLLVILECWCVKIDAVRRNPATCRAVDSEVDKAIKDWLRFASDRDGGRQRRAAKKAAMAQARAN
jgi:hypothetical protein